MKVCEYSVPTVAVPGAALVNCGATGAGLITMVFDPVLTTPLAFPAETTKDEDPATDGVPDSTPAEDKDSPTGNAPEVMEKVGAG